VDIRFINHASLFIRASGEKYFLTDPWYLSPAFGGWIQSPAPLVEAVKPLLSLPASQLHVIISHGHDDHLDEFIIRHHLRNATFYVPKFGTSGLSKRIEQLTRRYPIELTSVTHKVGDVSLNCFINADFTQYDSIVTLRDNNEAVIHANDNWHSYPPELMLALNEALTGVAANDRHFFIQYGIADCFPLNYPTFSQAEREYWIQTRFETYQRATETNLAGLGLKRGYYYANQSAYQYPGNWQGPTLYQLTQQFLQQNPGHFRQCVPGLDIKSDAQYTQSLLTLIEYCLQTLEQFVNNAVKSDIPVRFITSSAEYTPGTVAFEATPQLWSRILIGELTLEAIIIGGVGMIHKPAERNISDIHFKVSKLAYFIQSRVLASGLSFYFEQAA
jgi:hypothetical protein